METKKQLREELMNAELRAVTHFRKLQNVERIIREADNKKELYAITMMKIKNELAMCDH
jgi:hypothetical protein